MFSTLNLASFGSRFLCNTRQVSDPWGFGIAAEILRGNHEDWERHLVDLSVNSPDALEGRRKYASVVVRDLHRGGRGMRQRPKSSRAEGEAALLEQFAGRMDPTLDIDQLRAAKPGMSTILIRSMKAPAKLGLDLSTPEKILELLETNHDPKRLDDSGQPMLICPPELSEEALEALGVDEDPFFGLGLGDALAKWLDLESWNLAKYYQEVKADALEASNSIFGGSTSTGAAEAEEPGEVTESA